MYHNQHAVHRTILVVDVEKFGDRRKVRPHQVAIRCGLYGALQQAFHEAGIPWSTCHREDRGDGCLVLAPPEVPKDLFTDALPVKLVDALRQHNAVHMPEQHIRLRMALHAGEVDYDDYGVTSTSINLAFRLLDAHQLKAALAKSPGVLALIASSWFFDEVIQHSTIFDPARYRRIRVAVKETVAVAWISTPDHPYPASQHPSEVLEDRANGDDELQAVTNTIPQQWVDELALTRLRRSEPLRLRWTTMKCAAARRPAATLAATVASRPLHPHLHRLLDELAATLTRLPKRQLIAPSPAFGYRRGQRKDKNRERHDPGVIAELITRIGVLAASLLIVRTPLSLLSMCLTLRLLGIPKTEVRRYAAKFADQWIKRGSGRAPMRSTIAVSRRGSPADQSGQPRQLRALPDAGPSRVAPEIPQREDWQVR